MNASILVVDDEATFRLLAEEALQAEGFEVTAVSTLKRAWEECARSSPDIVILDRRLPDGDGIQFLKGLTAEGQSAPAVIVVTAFGDIQNAVEALHAGASDYLTKPVPLADLVVKVRKVLEARGLRDRLALARKSAIKPPRVQPKSPAMLLVEQRLRQVAVSPLTPVLLIGPSGVGKQYAAELLHTMTYSHIDQDAPFVEVNCAALPDDLVESELFGHEKGAFTDAKTARRGLIEMAAGGTLFLDEITELPPRSQAKLLKFIDEMKFRRLGGTREIEVRLRVVAASNQDIEAAVRENRLRDDLYHRLAVFTVTIPPLKDRAEDIPELAVAFASFFASRVGKRVTGLSPGAIEALCRYPYPGNVRELRNIIERAVILSSGPEIAEADLLLTPQPAPSKAQWAPPFFELHLDPNGGVPSLEQVEREYVLRVLDHFEGHRMQAAQALGISYPTFLRRLRELGVED
jgi:two-component system response regulator AtoC